MRAPEGFSSLALALHQRPIASSSSSPGELPDQCGTDSSPLCSACTVAFPSPGTRPRVLYLVSLPPGSRWAAGDPCSRFPRCREQSRGPSNRSRRVRSSLTASPWSRTVRPAVAHLAPPADCSSFDSDSVCLSCAGTDTMLSRPTHSGPPIRPHLRLGAVGRPRRRAVPDRSRSRSRPADSTATVLLLL